MPLHTIQVRPGFNTQLSTTANESGWNSCNLVRWQEGLLQKIGGWSRLFGTALAGTARSMHAWTDLSGGNDLLIGTDAGLQFYTIEGGGTTVFSTLSNSIGAIFTPTYVGTSGSSTITTEIPTGAGETIGEVMRLTMTNSMAGRIFLPNTNFTITSVVTGSPDPTLDTITFNMSTTGSLTTTILGSPQYVWALGTAIVQTGLYGFQLSNLSSIIATGGTITNDSLTSFYILDAGANQYVVSIPKGAKLTAVSKIDMNTISFSIIPFTNPPINSTTIYVSFFPALDEGTIYNATTQSFSQLSDKSFVILQPGSGTNTDWFTDNLGNTGLAISPVGPLLAYSPPPMGTVDYAIVQGAGTPTLNTGMFVAMPQAQVIVFGTQPILGEASIDPLLVRFSDAGSYTSWTATVSNQAGSYRLARGSKIVGGLQVPQTTLLWTDVDVWSMSYIGPPLIYGFTVMGTGCGIIGPHAATTLGRTTYWMGLNSFWTFGDSGVQPLACPVWDQVFANINPTYITRCFAGANSGFHEVWFFYPSASGTSGAACDSYVKYNPKENLWDFGTLTRTAWIDNSIFGTPLGAESPSNLVQQHEVGYDADTSPMSNVFAQTGYAQMSEGEQMPFIDQIIPDFKWFGATTGSVNITLQGVNYPGDSVFASPAVTARPTTQWLPARIRKREVQMRLDWASVSGFSARVEAIRFRIAGSGRQPS